MEEAKRLLIIINFIGFIASTKNVAAGLCRHLPSCFTHHDNGADGVGEEQDGECYWDGQAAGVHVPSGIIGGHWVVIQ